MNQNRIAPGVPTGGQFAAHDRADDLVDLRADLAETEAAERLLIRRKAIIAMQLVAADILAEHPEARYFEMAYSGGHQGTYGPLYADVILDEHGEPIVDEDGRDVIEFDAYDPYVRLVPRRHPSQIKATERDGVVNIAPEPEPGFDWLTYGPDSVRVDLHAVRAASLGRTE